VAGFATGTSPQLQWAVAVAPTADNSQFCIVGTYTRFSLRSQLQKVAIITARSDDPTRWIRYPLDLSREAPPNSVAGTFARGELTRSKLPPSGLGVCVPHAPNQVDHLCGLVAVRLFSGRHRNWIELGQTAIMAMVASFAILSAIRLDRQ
jgi:hypothetical protein